MLEATWHHEGDDAHIDAGHHWHSPGGFVTVGPLTIHAMDMAHLADVLAAASKAARAVAADQQYETGDAS